MLFFQDGKRHEDMLHFEEDAAILCFARRDELDLALERLGLEKPRGLVKKGNCFESHHELDFISLNIPDISGELLEAAQIEIYYTKNRLLIVSERETTVDLTQWAREHADGAELGNVLYQFIFSLIVDDAGRLEAVEEEIADLEDSVATDQQINYTASISALRKKLLVLKHYYESLVTLLEEFEENQNQLLSEKQLRLFGFLSSRAERLYRTVLNLRDYVTQVREAYQAQLDITQNKTMKLFTVITAIFLPLTLIAGWYGMNIIMPEFAFPYSYPIVIAVSIAVVIGCVAYFKKNKWF